MESFLAMAIGIIVFAMLIYSHEGIKKDQKDDEEKNI